MLNCSQIRERPGGRVDQKPPGDALLLAQLGAAMSRSRRRQMPKSRLSRRGPQDVPDRANTALMGCSHTLDLVAMQSCLAGLDASRCRTEPTWLEYNVPFPSPPQDGASANKSFFQRANLSIEYLACGWENRFLPTVVDRTNDPTNFWQDDILGIVIAKLQWLKLGHTGCNGTHNVAGDFYSSMFPSVSSNK